MAGQTAEDIRDNIVKIADEQGNCVGTGFFIHKEYCVTCHHSIWQLKEISVEREADPEKGREKRPYHAEWVEEFSDMQKDVAFLKVKGANFKPLQYRRETYGSIPVVVTGFPSQDLYNFPDGKEERGTLTNISRRFRWEKQEIIVADEGEDRKKKKWNIKPEIDVPAFAFDGKFHVGFSGAPVCFEPDWKVVGMFEAKDDNQGYMIPMHLVIEKFELEKEGKLSASSSTLDTQKIIDVGDEYLKHDYWSWNDHGLALYNLDRYSDAIKHFDKAIEIDPSGDAAAWYNKGLALSKIGKYSEAIKHFDKAIEIDPNHDWALCEKGLALYVLGKFKDAIACFDKALDINPNYHWALYNRALSRVKNGEDTENILTDLKKAIEIHKKYIKLAEQEKEFESMKNDERFKALIGK